MLYFCSGMLPLGVRVISAHLKESPRQKREDLFSSSSLLPVIKNPLRFRRFFSTKPGIKFSDVTCLKSIHVHDIFFFFLILFGRSVSK